MVNSLIAQLPGIGGNAPVTTSEFGEGMRWLGIVQNEETRRAYRELIVTTPALGECISGAILDDETIRQQKKDGTPFAKASTERRAVANTILRWRVQ